MFKNRISSQQCLVGLEFMRVEISLSFFVSDVVVGRENRDQSLDGGVNTLPTGYVSRGNECCDGYDWKYPDVNKFCIRRGRSYNSYTILKGQS